ncbi:hypothetical protein QTJ16_006942 [Diplocarpon rosae]|uniref:Uncharacterized protein n=1 Tax=Diplocarpon rosae TaxID=946125 RepID=A0AAD9WBX9_9HELO|nr:hypothetical protein QTJ16_006942 [Diplocarpon rosae]
MTDKSPIESLQHTPPTSPKTPTMSLITPKKNPGHGRSKKGCIGGRIAFSSASSKGTAGSLSPQDGLSQGIQSLSLKKTPPKPLLFKSYATGTLMTKNGEPTISPMSPLPAAASKISRLSAASPAFLPAVPSSPGVRAPADSSNISSTANSESEKNSAINSDRTQTPAYQKVQGLLQEMSTPSHSGYAGYNSGSHYGDCGSQKCTPQIVDPFAGYPTPPTGPRAMTHSPDYRHQNSARHRNTGTLAVQKTRHIAPEDLPHSREFIARKDKGQKDIIISASGAIRNAVRIVESHLPNGFPYQKLHHDYEPSKYDFIADFHTMSVAEKRDFLAKSFVDIQVHLDNAEEEDAQNVVKAGPNKKGKGKGKSEAAPLEVKPVEDPSKKVVKQDNTVIDTLKALGPDFAACTKRLTVTLIFPTPAIPFDALLTPAGAGPVSQYTTTPAAGSSQRTPNFRLLTQLVDNLYGMSNLTQMVINLLVPSQSRMPLSMPQLFHILPFYDMAFTEWEIKYQPDNLTAPLKVHGWAVAQLDRERDKIVNERLRKLEECIFVRQSAMPGHADLPVNVTAGPTCGPR